MNWMNGLSVAALSAALLSPLSALASHPATPRIEVSTHKHYAPPPPPPHRPSPGRYELKTVQKWVPGFYRQVWVAEHNHHAHRGHPHRHDKNCNGGYYTRQWVEGHYETAQQWVWVPAPSRRPTAGIRIFARL